MDRSLDVAHTPSVVRMWRAELFVRNLLDDRSYVAAARLTGFTKSTFNLSDFAVNVISTETRQSNMRLRLICATRQ